MFKVLKNCGSVGKIKSKKSNFSVLSFTERHVEFAAHYVEFSKHHVEFAEHLVEFAEH